MPSHVALLRAVNLGPHNKVGMPELCKMFGQLGLRDARSFIQSGNVVFEGDGRSSEELESLLEGAAKKRLGLDTQFFVRSAREWQRIIADNPFDDAAKRDPGHLVAFVMREAPSRQSVAALEAAIVGRERVHAKGRQAYLVYPDGIGRSRLTVKLVESKLGTQGTGRNWNTVRKLDALVNGD